MPYLIIFGLEFLKNCGIWNQHLQTYQIAKIGEKLKFTQFGSRNALFGYFWARILKKLWYLKSASSNLSNCKYWQKIKIHSIWEQKCLIWLFLG